MKSIFSIYIVWSVILALHGSWVVFTSNFGEKIGEEAFRNFVIMFYLGFILFFAFGAFLAWFTQKQKLWALWLFSAYCIYRGIDHIWGITVRERMEGIVVDTSNWTKGAIIAGVWLVLAGYAWYLRPNKSLQPTAESGG